MRKELLEMLQRLELVRQQQSLLLQRGYQVLEKLKLVLQKLLCHNLDIVVRQMVKNQTIDEMRFYVEDLVPNSSGTLGHMISVLGERPFTLEGPFLPLLMLQINDMLMANSFIADRFVDDRFVADMFRGVKRG
jgi:hypothetical protein